VLAALLVLVVPAARAAVARPSSTPSWWPSKRPRGWLLTRPS
jgi:hypothetical protein